MLKNILYISSSIIIFFIGLLCYGILLNSREIDLIDAMRKKRINKFENTWIKIDRKNYKLELYSDKILVKTYKAVFGKNNSIVKTSADDFVTPIGEYQICEIDVHSKYHKFLKINYPNEKDAAEAYKQGYINQNEYIKILDALSRNDCPPSDTRLGSNIGIHGIGEYDFIFRNLPFTFNWTNGSIAVSNKNIDELYSVVKVGTTVKIIY